MVEKPKPAPAATPAASTGMHQRSQRVRRVASRSTAALPRRRGPRRQAVQAHARTARQVRRPSSSAAERQAKTNAGSALGSTTSE